MNFERCEWKLLLSICIYDVMVFPEYFHCLGWEYAFEDSEAAFVSFFTQEKIEREKIPTQSDPLKKS
jgi:hypothetical protein